MRVRHFLFSALMLFVIANVANGVPVLGEDYVPLTTPQPTEAGKKVEVIEFFAYYCPHCNALDQSLGDWVKAQDGNIVFKRVHTTVTGEPMAQQRLFFTLETMGKLEEFHPKILYAIHFQKKHLDNDEQILDFVTEHGIDKQKFQDIYNSFTVQSKVSHAIKMQAAYDVHTWPTIVLDGRFVVSPPIAGAKLVTYDEIVAQNLMLKTMDELVAQLHEARAK